MFLPLPLHSTPLFGCLELQLRPFPKTPVSQPLGLSNEEVARARSALRLKIRLGRPPAQTLTSDPIPDIPRTTPQRQQKKKRSKLALRADMEWLTQGLVLVSRTGHSV